jgi:mRNA interferase RelE/StbE
MYEIVYHSLVLKDDFKKISKADQKKLVRAIDKKLTQAPDVFGKPLSAELRGYYRLRLDPYRVIYRIEKQKIIVYVIKIGLRKDLLAYIQAAKRLGLMKN